MIKAQVQNRPDKQAGNQKTILLVLGFVVLATIFLLPQFVSEPWVSDGSVDEKQISNTSPSDVKPSTAAEKTRYRQDAQTVLAQIIPLRDRLEDQSVDLWAAVEFQQGLDFIVVGDQKYSYGDYRLSLDDYRAALELFTAIEISGQEKLESAITAGLEAIESLNLVVAGKASELANAIAGQDHRVQQVVSRFDSLPELIDQMDSGDQARNTGDLELALIAYRQAVGIDPLHRRANESLSSVKTDITDRKFRRHMSRAYSAMDSGDYEAAVVAFNEAGTIYPGHTAISQGLAQVRNRNSQQKVNQQIARASELEANEQWAQAVIVYDTLLTQDPTLTEAKVKLIPARVRAGLDLRLNEIIDEPLKLAEPSEYRSAYTSLVDARGISDPGHNLQSQIGQIEVLLKRALTSVNVIFESDNLTDVTLFRVARLGQFQQTSLTLKPGKYIAAGTRRGYRDVRVEFIITGEPLENPIVVSCQEPI